MRPLLLAALALLALTAGAGAAAPGHGLRFVGTAQPAGVQRPAPSPEPLTSLAGTQVQSSAEATR